VKKNYKEPVVNNKDMNIEDFCYSSEGFDYCIVNGESLTRYYGKEPGEYESCPIHKLMNPYNVLQDEDNKWISE